MEKIRRSAVEVGSLSRISPLFTTVLAPFSDCLGFLKHQQYDESYKHIHHPRNLSIDIKNGYIYVFQRRQLGTIRRPPGR